MRKQTYTEETDELVTAQANDDYAWEAPIKVEHSWAAMLTFYKEWVARLPFTSDPEIMSGMPVFRGTRVPVTALLDNLAAGLTLDQFLDNFPTVTREQAIKVLEFSKEMLARLGHAA